MAGRVALLVCVMMVMLWPLQGVGVHAEGPSPVSQAQPAQGGVQPVLPPQTVAAVDLSRYMGQWYEIAAIPIVFERRCVADSLANYSLLPDQKIEVVNSCRMANGQRIASIGRAWVTDPQTNAKLRVAFTNIWGVRRFARGDYWILSVDPEYRFAIVGHPTRRYGWILSRTPLIPPENLVNLSKQLVALGYDPCRFMIMPQYGGITQRLSLCQLVK